nr:thioredoxin [uncultured bacterium]
MKSSRWFVVILVVAAMAFTRAIAEPEKPGTATKEEKEPAAPASTQLAAIGAEGVGKLITEAKGKVVVLNFWATWCPPCVAEMPELAKFYNKTKREEVVFISLCANEPSDLRTAVAKFQKDKSLPFPVYVLNESGGVEALAKATKANLSGGLPTTLIYDKTGALKSMWERDTTFDELSGAIKPLL